MAEVVLRGIGAKLVIQATSGLMYASGQEKAAKTLYNIGPALVSIKTAGDLYSVAKSKNK